SEQILNCLTGRVIKPRTANLHKLSDPGTGEMIDRGLVLWFPGPESYTGEDVCEFHVHGGQSVTAKMLEVLSSQEHCRLAEPGEFSRRAYDNGKMDLTAAEGFADLIYSDTDAQRRQALRQSSGELARIYEGWRKTIVEASALTEAGLDFSDEEDVPQSIIRQAKPNISSLHASILQYLDDGRRGEILRDGYHVVIAGPPNAGKSSLLNILARRDAAIVSEKAGTTRDIIEVYLDLNGFPVIISDTAGIRKTQESIEQEGINRTLKRASEADLVVWLSDLTSTEEILLPNEFQSESGKPVPVILKVDNKVDLCDGVKPDNSGNLCISALTGDGISSLISEIARNAAELMGYGEQPVITRTRHRACLEDCVRALDDYLKGDLENPELRAEDLRSAASAIGRITGRVDVEEILDQLFGTFCIGK
ncbi:MAG: tRNA uridine-5-carboxymethylaminomethyl(34) synthesis GTPase MnmE, partial [Desulfobulbia bacterium]